MRRILKIIFILFLAGSAFSIPTYYFWYKSKFKQAGPLFNRPIKIPSEELARLKTKASSLKKYIVANHYSSTICFLVDMKIASGRKRFFVYDLQKDSILLSGLVAHGSCDNGFQMEASFSNKVNSGCSCMGKFRIGSEYNGRFGLAYKLYGLDSSNSNTYERAIVLHSYGCVPEQEIYPVPVCNSRGCPMVSSGFLQKLKPYVESSGKPIVLNIFN
ncbi:MAG: murein L,D-transpeptidase catalytic domain-containing protein [Ginsengibacter sp.]